MKELILKNVTLFDGRVTDVITQDGKIVSVSKTDKNGKDCTGMILTSGLIDIHTHGCIGYDASEGGLREMSRHLLPLGVTSWLPTTTTMPLDVISAATKNLPEQGEDEARIIGYHMEGPFLNAEYCGAQKPEWLLPADAAFVNDHPHIKLVTVAPETEGALEEIKKMNAAVALGHSAADYDTAMKAFEAGAKCLTHTFNAMAPLHHRKPSLIGAAFDANAYAQVISDGIHMHPATVRVLYRLFGADRIILISDSIRATDLADGEYAFGGHTITVKDGSARLPDGTLAGSTVTLPICVERAISFGIPPKDAYKMASETPAAMLGLKKGKIEVGYDAEFLLLDTSYKICEVIIG